MTAFGYEIFIIIKPLTIYTLKNMVRKFPLSGKKIKLPFVCNRRAMPFLSIEPNVIPWAYTSGTEPGVRLPPRGNEDMLGVLKIKIYI